ncbi:hypothetical protein [Streptomyces sp. IBSBF 2435]|uniref:hypothetical protein n=1 Tax=Streptomyces sp. IBSBF 2435 TaxID=2903531 RepID=UPI002FDBF767
MPASSRILVAICAAAAAAAALSACGGDDRGDSSAPLLAPAATTSSKAEPYADLSARELLDRAETGMRDSGAMTVDLTGTDEGAAMHVKAALTTEGRCAVAASVDGDTFQIIGTGAGAYVKGDAGFWRDNASDGADGDTAADRLAGKWARLSEQEFTDSGLDYFCVLDELLDDMTSDDDKGTLTKNLPTTLDGKPVIPLVHTTSDGTTTIYVSTGDTPYVVKSESTGGDSPDVGLYSDFGKPPHIAAPPPSLTVDPGDLGGDQDGGGFRV